MVTPTHPAHSRASAPDVTEAVLTLLVLVVGGMSSLLIVFGRTRWWGQLLFSVFAWTGMMVLPPMAPMLGRFSPDKYSGIINGYALDTLPAHLTMGLTLAASVHVAARDRGLVFDLATAGRTPAGQVMAR